MPTTALARTRHSPDWMILSIACLAQFMVVLDVSIVNVALPRMSHDLHFTITSAQWVVNAYVLTFAGFLLLGGRAADYFGRRHVYLAGIAVFTVASVGAGLAATGSQMVAVRAIQGLGGAILSPATLTIIVTTFHGPRLLRAIGVWSAVAGAGGAVGGLLGGILTGLASWRWVFFINVPLGVAAGVAATLYLRELRSPDATAKLDVTGAVLVTGGLAAVIYAVVNTTSHPWGSPETLDWLLGGTALLVAFLFWEARVASHPLMPFGIFRSRPLSTANGVMVLVGGAFFAMWYFLSFYFQFILGYGPVRAGFAFMPMSVGIIAGAQISSRLIGRAGVRPLLVAGSLLAAVGFYWLSFVQTTSGYWSDIALPSFCCAFAMGVLFPPLAAAATAGVDRAQAGLASGVLNTARQVGGSIALAALGTVAADRTAALLRSGSAAHAVALVSGYDRVFEVSAAITLAAFLVSLALPGHVGRHAHDARTPAVEPAG